MVEIEIDEQQREHLERLRTRLADEHVGEYGHVRYRDVVQYLIDQNESTDGETDATSQGEPSKATQSDEVDTADAAESGADAVDRGGDAGTGESADDGERTDSAGDAGDDGSTSRLQRMMSLLDEHGDVWEQTDSEEGRYAVTLPDGTTERVRTKDDVRALLFRHYD